MTLMKPERLKALEEAAKALERAFDEGVHTTTCEIRKSQCTCWVAEAQAALEALDETK